MNRTPSSVSQDWTCSSLSNRSPRRLIEAHTSAAKRVRLVVGMITAQHQELRVHRERLPLHPLELANVMQTGQHLGKIIGVEDHSIGGQAFG